MDQRNKFVPQLEELGPRNQFTVSHGPADIAMGKVPEIMMPGHDALFTTPSTRPDQMGTRAAVAAVFANRDAIGGYDFSSTDPLKNPAMRFGVSLGSQDAHLLEVATEETARQGGIPPASTTLKGKGGLVARQGRPPAVPRPQEAPPATPPMMPPAPEVPEQEQPQR